MKQQIDWKPFVEIVKDVFDNDTKFGGRPNTDEKVVVRCLLLQAWYGLSDPELEFQCNARISFQNFIGLDQTIPDFSTIWKIRDRLKERGKERMIWDELRQHIFAFVVMAVCRLSLRRVHKFLSLLGFKVQTFSALCKSRKRISQTVFQRMMVLTAGAPVIVLLSSWRFLTGTNWCITLYKQKNNHYHDRKKTSEFGR